MYIFLRGALQAQRARDAKKRWRAAVRAAIIQLQARKGSMMSDKSAASQSEIRDLVARLADFSSRGRARTRLVMIGLDATDALVDALTCPLEGVAWAAARTLGDIKAEAAIEALNVAAADPRLKTVAAEAIAAITGGDAPSLQASAAQAPRVLPTKTLLRY